MHVLHRVRADLGRGGCAPLGPLLRVVLDSRLDSLNEGLALKRYNKEDDSHYEISL